MSQYARRGALLSAAAIAAVLATAPTALADAVNYDVAPAPQYAVKDNGSGLVKITYNGCLVVGQRAQISFNTTVNVGRGGTATYKVLQEQGIAPQATFDPASVTLAQGQSQTLASTISFVPSTVVAAGGNALVFRFKLDPEQGAGIGQAAGVRVEVPCVIQPPPPGPGEPPAQTPPGGTPPPPAGDQPQQGVLTSAAQSVRQGPARCIAVPRSFRVRAGQTRTLRVKIATGDLTIENALVRVTGPGFVLTRRTGTNGIAVFRLRPVRSGRIVVQTDVCFGAETFRALRRARTAQEDTDSGDAPRFTG